jgi:hypothetical protein
VHEKDVLLGFVGWGGRQEIRDPLKPNKVQINTRSKFITNCNQRSQMSIYEYCSIKEAEKEKLLETERVEKSKTELEKCTFQPKVLPRRF